MDHERGRLARYTLGRIAHSVARAALPVIAGLTFALAACESDPASPPVAQDQEVAVIVNSGERSLTVIPVDSPANAFTIGLAPDGSPVTLAVRDEIAVVPLGSVPGVAIVDLSLRTVTHAVPLPQGSGATGAAFLNDSIALVANPSLNTVSPVNVLRGTRGDDIAVGTFPQAIVAIEDTAFVLNARLGPDFEPTGPGTVSVIAGSPAQVVATIELSGTNPGAAWIGESGSLYVLSAGRFGSGEGALSVVDRGSLVESSYETGFGDFPGAIARAPDGRVLVSSFSYGIAVWDPATSSFVAPPTAAIEPGGVASTAGIGFDGDGRLYALRPSCVEPGSVYRLDAAFAVEREIATGICPFAIAFTTVPESP